MKCGKYLGNTYMLLALLYILQIVCFSISVSRYCLLKNRNGVDLLAVWVQIKRLRCNTLETNIYIYLFG